MARYDRSPSAPFEELLLGPLAPLRRRWSCSGLPLDLQLREGDAAQLYCGLTCLVKAERARQGFRLTAHETYTRQSCAAALLRVWAEGEAGLEEALRGYLEDVAVGPSHVEREGTVQAGWMQVTAPWAPIDREAKLGYRDEAERGRALALPAVQEAWSAVDALSAAEGWCRLKKLGSSNEVDQLALDPEGSVVLVELKYGRADDLYGAPVQALRYLWEWHHALEEVLPGLQRLVAARRRLGLSPAELPEPRKKLRWAVAVGREQPSAEVRQRLERVCALVREYVPEGVFGVELWRLDEVGRAAPL